MTVDKFYDTYAESELLKQDRHGIKDDGKEQDKAGPKFIRVNEDAGDTEDIPRQESEPALAR